MTSRPARAAVFTFALIVSLFFLWGVANNLNDILIKQFKKAFELSDFRAGLVQSAFYLGYFLLAVPAGVCMRMFGYKGALLIGLGLYATGALLFYPAAAMHSYSVFLSALFVIASGLAFLETSANPLVTVLGPAKSAAQRLNLAQSFNALGSISAVLTGKYFIFSGIEHTPPQLAAMTPVARQAYLSAEATAVQTPYLVIGAIVALWGLLVALTRFPVVAAQTDERTFRGKAPVARLLRNHPFIFALITQFFYVGAQVGVWSYLIRYVQGTVPGTPEKAAADFLFVSLVVFMVGRFVGSFLLQYLSPGWLLAGYAATNITLMTMAISIPGWIGTLALVAASFFMSVMFPTIFASGLSGLDDGDRKLGASFLVMAIIGGAILTALMGAVSDWAGIHWAMIVPGLCFVVVLAFALYVARGKPVIVV